MPAPSERRPQVLLVEDNEALADNMAELLEDLDVGVTICSSVSAARDATTRVAPSLAVIDVGLPDANGVEFLEELRQSRPDAEVILVTGRGTLKTAMEAIRLGAYGYLLKPVDPEGFVQLCERALAAVSLRAERKLLAQMLSDSEALHRTIVDAVDTCILGLDDEGGIVFANRQGRELFDGSVARGESFAELFDDVDAVRDRVRACCQGESADTWDAQSRGRHIRWHLSRVRAERAAPTSVAVGVDMTEQFALRRQAAEREALAAVGVLTAGLAHEIRNPLNAAQLQLQLLSRRAAAAGDTAKVVERADLVQGELRRLSTLLDDFLNLARPRPVAERSVDLCALLHDVLTLETELCNSHGINIELSCEGPIIVYGDADQLRQAILNLVANAYDAIRTTERAGTIGLDARRDGALAEVRVWDDGPGLPSGDIFEPFHTTKPAGTGLGLSIVRKIIRLHGGEPKLVPRAEGGVVASFTLPLQEPIEG